VHRGCWQVCYDIPSISAAIGGVLDVIRRRLSIPLSRCRSAGGEISCLHIFHCSKDIRLVYFTGNSSLPVELW
jgi:hypothetical protein